MPSWLEPSLARKNFHPRASRRRLSPRDGTPDRLRGTLALMVSLFWFDSSLFWESVALGLGARLWRDARL